MEWLLLTSLHIFDNTGCFAGTEKNDRLIAQAVQASLNLESEAYVYGYKYILKFPL